MYVGEGRVRKREGERGWRERENSLKLYCYDRLYTYRALMDTPRGWLKSVS